MPFRLKDTGESYEQFLKRSRREEKMAKDCLPENKQLKAYWEAENELMDLMAKPGYEYLGFMNGWGDDDFAKLENLKKKGHKFKTIVEGPGLRVTYSLTAEVAYRSDSRD